MPRLWRSVRMGAPAQGEQEERGPTRKAGPTKAKKEGGKARAQAGAYATGGITGSERGERRFR